MKNYDKNVIAHRLQVLMTECNMSRKELSKKTQISATRICNILNGKAPTIGSEILYRLAKVFDISTDYLLGLRDNPERLPGYSEEITVFTISQIMTVLEYYFNEPLINLIQDCLWDELLLDQNNRGLRNLHAGDYRPPDPNE